MFSGVHNQYKQDNIPQCRVMIRLLRSMSMVLVVMRTTANEADRGKKDNCYVGGGTDNNALDQFVCLEEMIMRRLVEK